MRNGAHSSLLKHDHARNLTKSGGIARIFVRTRPGDKTRGVLQAGPLRLACALGRGGIVALKREGDGGTPLGAMRLIFGYARRDRKVPLVSPLPLRAIRASDGWCDAPGDAGYNRPVRLPYPASAERMMREDRLYDACIVLDHNFTQRRRGLGSAIFLHVAKPGFQPTEGCIALAPNDMKRLLPLLSNRTVLHVLR